MVVVNEKGEEGEVDGGGDEGDLKRDEGYGVPGAGAGHWARSVLEVVRG